jgi:predicted SPOUT superfamily RNA methylase MTH1
VNVDGQVEVELANRDEIQNYWGYMVTVEKHSLAKVVKSRSFDLSVATSKCGIPFVNVVEEIAEKWKKAKTILVVFGAPSRGLYEIVKNDGLNLSDVADFVVNTIPMQGTETVRTEEAVVASLAILNMHFCF